MNKKQLENLGIKHLTQNKYAISVATNKYVMSIHITINSDTSMSDIMQQVFDRGYQLGLFDGGDEKVHEIKKILNIE